ncbi:5-formyltetrahydrofolate cyclo-ligase [Brochothrix campestris]|uniref:5-formyltetrahydrofolate cyclo-ligase n=1 Tax=Brochothrix campestris FSL F6-1037 TaxID=1265861 RepID=W7D8B3_9LIST|nr:5-formyltetrahydrofolate cyclo-ligase [Brochothrix campestris]EUJ41678.1 5-formyltetrahydrofolate cyclo-ligase [Brochothrix campestris FSL F6-1037]
MTKQRLRQRILSKLATMAPNRRLLKEQQLYQQLFSSPNWQKATTIGITMSKAPEIATQPIIEQAWAEQKRVVIPRTQSNERLLLFCNYTKSTPTQSLRGIEEPLPTAAVIDAATIDLLIVPGVAFNTAGYRIGFGGGYYDRLLGIYRGTTISLAFSEQLVTELPVEAHDLPVQTVLVAE